MCLQEFSINVHSHPLAEPGHLQAISWVWQVSCMALWHFAVDWSFPLLLPMTITSLSCVLMTTTAHMKAQMTCAHFSCRLTTTTACTHTQWYVHHSSTSLTMTMITAHAHFCSPLLHLSCILSTSLMDWWPQQHACTHSDMSVWPGHKLWAIS